MGIHEDLDLAVTQDGFDAFYMISAEHGIDIGRGGAGAFFAGTHEGVAGAVAEAADDVVYGVEKSIECGAGYTGLIAEFGDRDLVFRLFGLERLQGSHDEDRGLLLTDIVPDVIHLHPPLFQFP